jgi:hypothetical protein
MKAVEKLMGARGSSLQLEPLFELYNLHFNAEYHGREAASCLGPTGPRKVQLLMQFKVNGSQFGSRTGQEKAEELAGDLKCC